jgi:hypothetical protein
MISAACLLGTAQLTAQNLVDATRFSSTNINGTARYNSMAGAFGAVGGDASSMDGNPAGTAIFRGTSEVSLTTNFATARTETGGDVAGKMKKRDFSIGNLSYILSVPTEQCDHLVNFTLGLGFNHSEGVNRRYATGWNGLTPASSFAGYLATLTNRSLINAGRFDDPGYLATSAAWNNTNRDNIPLLSLMGYNSYAIDDAVNAAGQQTGGVEGYDSQVGANGYADLYVREENRMDEYNFNIAGNWEDFIYAGLTLSVVDFNSIINTNYSEYYDDASRSYTYYDNDLETKGTGVNLKFGAIIKPIDSWRLGLAVHTPTWYQMKDIYNGWMSTNGEGQGYKPGDVVSAGDPAYEYSYRFSSPWKYQFSTAYVFGNRGLLSFEYDMDDYRSMRYSSDDDSYGEDFSVQKALIKDYMKEMHTFRVGGEYRLTPQFSLRAGYAHSTSPYKDKIYRQVYEYADDPDLIYSSSTKPNYLVQGESDYVCGGFGWRGKVAYLNFSCVHKYQRDRIAAFPMAETAYMEYGDEILTVPGVENRPVSLKTKTLNFDLSLGFRF